MQHFIQVGCVHVRMCACVRVCARVGAHACARARSPHGAAAEAATQYESTGVGSKQTGVRAPALSLASLGPWEDSYLVSLSLTFLIHKMGRMIIPISKRCEN